jgi:hypothetical protein
MSAWQDDLPGVMRLLRESSSAAKDPQLPYSPAPNPQNAASSTTLSGQGSTWSPESFIASTQKAMQMALEAEDRSDEDENAGTGPKPGVTLDMSRKGIQILPEEVVDIIKDRLERYMLCLALREVLKMRKRLNIVCCPILQICAVA